MITPGIVEAVCAVVTILGGTGSFVFMAGRFSAAISENTRATQLLSKTVDKLAEKTEAKHDGLDKRVDDHELRITIIEKTRNTTNNNSTNYNN